MRLLNEEINTTIDKMILSASGWRGIFAMNGGEESASSQISAAHKVICGAAAFVFSEFIIKNFKTKNVNSAAQACEAGCSPLILLGADTRPTGIEIINSMIPVLLDQGCEVRYAGVAAAPEIMAWSRGIADRAAGFIYVSASHNPIGHNGLKFGLTDGGVLAADDANKLIADFRLFLNVDDNISKIEKLIFSMNSNRELTRTEKGHDNTSLCDSRLENSKNSKMECYKAYYDFCDEVAWGGSASIVDYIKKGLVQNPLGIVCDFNGSARTVSIDKEFFSALGLGFESINSEPGKIAHRIVPEGESLEPCAKLLEQAHSHNASYVLGYVPDCDGDRGNLVIWDEAAKKTRALDAQEVFALACTAEFSHLVWTGGISCDDNGGILRKAAVAVNDPTSMRIDKIAGTFGISVFRAEVGEANVVSLARKLRANQGDEDGYLVRILGEGSAGGNITHPSSVRDPINTVLAIVKMLLIRSVNENDGCYKPGFFEIWCKLSNQMDKYRDDFTLADIIASLPAFTTTPAYNKDAVLRINTKDHAILKERYQKIFLREWEERKSGLKTRFGILSWEAIAYNGTAEKRNLIRFGEAGRGGLKILFSDINKNEIAYIWMRGSATEPVFRIMADVSGSEAETERYLLDWQRKMIMEADNNGEC